VSEYSEIVFQEHNGLCATWNQATTCSTKSEYSDTLLESASPYISSRAIGRPVLRMLLRLSRYNRHER